MAANENFEEWYSQSDYDLETVVDMFNSKRYIYAIFMCHLSIEKALKGLYIKTTKKFPLKTHNLLYFVTKLDLKMNQSDIEFVSFLNNVSIPTRYPESLKSLITTFTKDVTNEILTKTINLQLWIKQQ